MSRRKICSLSVAFLLGIAAMEYRLVFLWCILIFYGAVWLYSIRKSYKDSVRSQMLFSGLLLIVLFLGSYDSYSQNAFRKNYESVLEENKECLIQGEIYQREQEDESYLYYLKDCKMQLNQKDYSCNQILVSLNAEEYFIGEILCVKGKIQTFALPRNEGNYNERQYYQSLKIDFKLEGQKILGVYGEKNNFKELLNSVKEKIKDSYETAMPKADAGVLIAMTLGDKSLMDKERKDMYQNAGISHFYSISGLHISMLGMALYHFLRKRGGSYLLAGGISAVFILCYGELIGYGISASRAIGMFLVLLYGKFRGRSYDRITALSLMAALLVGENPRLLHHAGCLLSFGAVIGVIVAEYMLKVKGGEQQENDRAREEKSLKKFLIEKGNSIKENILVSVFIQIITIPIMCQFFYEISVYTVLVNLLVLPCMGVLLGLGILGGITGCFLPWIGKLLLYPCYIILILFEMVCEGFLNLPYATLITGELPLWKIFFWYSLVAVFLLCRHYGVRIHMMGLLVVLSLVLILQKTTDFELNFLDVGQGDGICLSTGDGTSIFIDGGSSDVSKVGIYRILPFLKCNGMRKIDYWFVSHCDADHISGLLEIIEEDYRIEHLVVAEHMLEDQSFRKLETLAKQDGIKILRMNQGECIRSDNKDFDSNWSIKCLAPGAIMTTEDRNENSMALLFANKDCIGFFAGDMEKKQEEMLIMQWDLPKVDVYKASHHGSNGSSCSALLEELRPEISVISCGLNNSYGHPGKETLERLKAVGSKVLRTDESGAIVLKSVQEITSQRLELEKQDSSMLE